jgi:hypothetical protein
LRQKIKKEKTRPEERYSAPIYCPHLFACKVAEASRLLVVKAPRQDADATLGIPAPSRPIKGVREPQGMKRSLEFAQETVFFDKISWQ